MSVRIKIRTITSNAVRLVRFNYMKKKCSLDFHREQDTYLENFLGSYLGYMLRPSETSTAQEDSAGDRERSVFISPQQRRGDRGARGAASRDTTDTIRGGRGLQTTLWPSPALS